MTDTNASRSLSISYGTFSITLDGFDDPFPIMRRVTEYFRRVAAQDQGFGSMTEMDQTRAMDIISETLGSEELSIESNASGIMILPRGKTHEDMQTTPVFKRAEAIPQAETPVVTNSLFTDNEFEQSFSVPDFSAETLVLDSDVDQSEQGQAQSSENDIDKFDTSRVFRRPLRIIRSTYEETTEEELDTTATTLETDTDKDDIRDSILSELRGDPFLRFGVKSEEKSDETPIADPIVEEASTTEDASEINQSFKRLRLKLDENEAEEGLVLVANNR